MLRLFKNIARFTLHHENDFLQLATQELDKLATIAEQY